MSSPSYSSHHTAAAADDGHHATLSSALSVNATYSPPSVPLDFDENIEYAKQTAAAQRRSARWKLFLSLALIIAYLLIGGALFRLLEGHREVKNSPDGKPKKWTYLNAVYFCAVTLTTIGYGDIYPTYWASKLFNVFYIITGLALVGFAISSLGQLVSSWSESIATNYIKELIVDRGKRWAERKLTTIASSVGETSPLTDTDVSFDEAPVGWTWRLASRLYDFFWNNIGFTLSVLLFLVFEFLGALLFMFLEDWDYPSAMYFCIITLTTIGYGDMSPSSTAGRIVLIFYAFLGLGVMANMIGQISSVAVNKMTRLRSTRDAITLVTMEELLTSMEDTVPRLKSCDNAIIIQNRLLQLVKRTNDRVMELQLQTPQRRSSTVV